MLKIAKLKLIIEHIFYNYFIKHDHTFLKVSLLLCFSTKKLIPFDCTFKCLIRGNWLIAGIKFMVITLLEIMSFYGHNFLQFLVFSR